MTSRLRSSRSMPTSNSNIPGTYDIHAFQSKFDVKSLNDEEERILTFMMSLDITRLIILTMNLVLGMSGILFFAFGLIYVSNPNSLMNGAMKRNTNKETSVIYHHIFSNVGIFFIVLGLANVLSFLYGFYVSSKVKGKLMLSLAIIVFWLTLCQIFFVFFNLHPNMHHDLKNTMKRYIFHNLSEDIRFSNNTIMMPENIVWTATQLNFNCCGIDGPSDYFNFTDENRLVQFYDKVKLLVVPISCCTTKIFVENAAAILDVDFEHLEKCIDGNEIFYKHYGCFNIMSRKIQSIKNKLFVAECIISIINVYFMAFSIFDCWASHARHFVL